MTTDDAGPGRWAQAAAAAVGLLVGGGAVLGVAAAVGSDPVVQADPSGVATTTSATTVGAAPAVWVDPREVVIGSTALVPTGLTVASGELSLTYDLVSIAPALTEDAEGDPPETVFPTTWTAFTSAGEFAGTTSAVNSRRARFVVPEGLIPADVHGIRLDAYRVPVPFSFDLPIPFGDGSLHEIVPGISARVDTVLEQRENSILTVALDGDDGFLLSDIIINGDGPEWVRASRSQLGRRAWTLDFRGERLPDPLPLVAHGLLWAQIDDPLVVDIAGLAE